MNEKPNKSWRILASLAPWRFLRSGAVGGSLTIALAAACGANRGAPEQPASQAGAPSASSAHTRTASPVASTITAPSAPAQIDSDGNDEDAAGDATVPEGARFVKVGRHGSALERVCDFAVRGNALYMAHATQPLGLDGATITRYEPGENPEFSPVFDWNRPGEPAKGGGGGQGFLRLRQFGGRIYVPDADPPYLGFGLAKGMSEGYVFVSDESAHFDPARRPGHRPPKTAVVLPGALHVLDVIRFRKKMLASTGALVPPNGSGKISPGTLFVEGSDPGRWNVAFTYSGAPGEAAVRLGYMVRFRDRLLVAISPLEGRDRNDYVLISPAPDQDTLEGAPSRAISVAGGVHTLRWVADRGRLYWITIGSEGGKLRASEDGEHWSLVALPAEAGFPSDLLRVGNRLFVLAERGLVELSSNGARLIARVDEAKTPFKVDDAYCAAPLVAFDGALYAGSQRKGALYKIAVAAP